MIYSHLSEFGGLPVQDWEAATPLEPGVAYRLAQSWQDRRDWPELLQEFLAQPGAGEVTGLVVGVWSEEMGAGTPPDDVVEALAGAAGQLTRLQVLFFGDITYEESEISWIVSTDLAPLLSAYPHLTHLGIRGGQGLSLGRVDLPQLRQLVIQSSGLDARVVREVMTAHLPALRHLELYVGDMGYGGDSTPEDLTPLLDGKLFPRLDYLGLKNSLFQAELAQILAAAPVLDGLQVLDLSLGAFEPEGISALLGSEKVARLERLILRGFHEAADLAPLRAKLGAKLETDEDGDAAENWRYVTLSE